MTTTSAFTPPLPDAALFDIGEWPIVYARFPELGEADRVPRTLRSLDAVLDLFKRHGFDDAAVVGRMAPGPVQVVVE